MDKTFKQWRSPSLGRDMKLAVYGTSGTPVIGLPTRGKTCEQWEQKGMTEAISHQLEKGYNQLYCIDSVDRESFLNENVEPEKRMVRHQQYETYVVEEVIPFIKEQNNIDFIIVAGVDIGGYHAINMALKHPGKFGKAIGISGLYDIKIFLDDFYSDNVYYNNPVDFIPNLNKRELLRKIQNVDYRLVSYKQDQRMEQAQRMSDVLRMKFIEHELDVWDVESNLEWELWPNMLKTHII